MPLKHIPINPIRDVQSAIKSQCKKIVRRYRFRLARSLQQKQLWQDRDTFQPDRERPEDFRRRISVWEDHCEDQRATEQILYAEGIEIRVMGGLVCCCHEVDGVT